MSYIWNDYSWKNRFKVSYTNVSPYMEVWDRDKEQIYVNILYRLGSFLIPKAILDSSEKLERQMERYICDERYGDIANLVMHYIARSDLLRGISLTDLTKWICLEEIQEGRYGQKARHMFNGLKDRERESILRYLALYELDAQRKTVFDSALYEIFGTIRLYYENSTKTVYIYIGEKKNEYSSMVFDVCCYFFKDAGVKAEVMWKGQHFGIMGTAPTMIIGETALI